jgi:magnesium transporter
MRGASPHAEFVETRRNPMIRACYRNSKGNFSIDIPQTHWRVALRDAGGMLWVDISDEPLAKIEPIFREVFNFHALAIDDALQQSHIPKVDNWGDYAYLVVHGIVFDTEKIDLTTRELDVFLGANFLVTYHWQPVEATHRVWLNTLKDQRRLEAGADHVLYELLDSLTADYLPAIDALDGVIDDLESEVFSKPTQATLNTIFSVKRAVLTLRRIIGPQREVLNKLARDDYAMIDPKDRVYFRDVYDHLVRMVDLNENLRDLTSGALDTYLSVTSNRMNEIMKMLTLISALFLPASFWAGFFGMNFTLLPFETPWFLLIGGGLITATPAALFLWFRNEHWL